MGFFNINLHINVYADCNSISVMNFFKWLPKLQWKSYGTFGWSFSSAPECSGSAHYIRLIEIEDSEHIRLVLTESRGPAQSAQRRSHLQPQSVTKIRWSSGHVASAASVIDVTSAAVAYFRISTLCLFTTKEVLTCFLFRPPIALASGCTFCPRMLTLAPV